MPLKVIFHFTGLCAFAPAKPIDQPDNAATIVLVNATESQHVPHFALCFADKVNTYKEAATNRPVDLAFTYDDNGTSRPVNGCRWKGEELTLTGQTAAGVDVPLTGTPLKFESGAITDCPVSEPQSFRWVVEMATQGAGKISSDALTKLDPLVAMRMKLDQGTLKTDGFCQVKDGVVRFSFDGGRTSAALAEEVAWEYEFPTSAAVKIVLKSSSGGNPLVLEPRGSLIEAWIVNMPLGQVVGFETAKPFEPDVHFTEFFRLADKNPTPVFPTPVKDVFCPPLADVSNPKCPPVQFAA